MSSLKYKVSEFDTLLFFLLFRLNKRMHINVISDQFAK